MNNDATHGRIPKSLSLKWAEEADRAWQELCAEIEAFPEPTRKELCDLLFEETERIIKAKEKYLKYTEPLRVIGLGDYKI